MGDQLIEEARQHDEAGDKQLACKILLDVLADDPQNYKAWALLAQIADNLDDAEELLRPLLNM